MLPALRVREEDDGFILLESLISISLIVVIIAAVGAFFVTANQSGGALRTRQSAAELAGNAVDEIRAMQPKDTYAGHSSSAVSTQIANAPASVSSWLGTMYPAYDNTAVGSVPLPITQTTQIGSTTFTATDYVGYCAVPVSGSNTACLTSCPAAADQVFGACTPGYDSSVDTAAFIRVVLAVTWSDTHCAASVCSFVTSTLLSADTDPDFLLNQSPPSPPVVNSIANQTSAVNDTVSLQATLAANSGVNPITWAATGLPAGLSMAPDTGVMGGIPSGPAANPVTVTVIATDAFGRTANTTFTWKILPDLVPSSPTAQSSMVGKAITSIQMTATGGTGTGYVWSATAGALPPGITISSAGVISGTPTAAWPTANATVTVADSSGRLRTRTITWTVYAQPTVTGMSAFYALPGLVTAEPLTYQCASSTCTLTLSSTGAPTGAGLSATPTGSGTASLAVTATSGTVYVVSTLPTSGSPWNPSVTITDTTFGVTSAATTATWTAAVPAVTGTANSAFTSQPLRYTCAATSCTLTVTSKAGTGSAVTQTWLAPDASTTAPASSLIVPQGSGAFYLRGTLPATGTYTITVKMVDGSTNRTVMGTWSVS